MIHPKIISEFENLFFKQEELVGTPAKAKVISEETEKTAEKTAEKIGNKYGVYVLGIATKAIQNIFGSLIFDLKKQENLKELQRFQDVVLESTIKKEEVAKIDHAITGSPKHVMLY